MDSIYNEMLKASRVNIPSVKARKGLLYMILENINKYDELLMQAINKDTGKSNYESYLTEISLVIKELEYFIDNLEEWADNTRKNTPLLLFPARSFTVYQPLGVVLIISPWNYPVYLSISPLIGAVAAGNRVFLKPSSKTPSVTEAIDKYILEGFTQDLVYCVKSDNPNSKKLLDYKWDHIFFTGSTNVGREVMQKAALNLTPVTLELGGKCPTIVHSDCNPKKAAKRIAWGKTINAGQTCIAPDYVLVENRVKDSFINEITMSIKDMLGDKPHENSYYPNIINRVQFDKILGYLSNQNILYGGEYNAETMKIAPALILNPTLESSIMKNEIFGPLLPVITYDDIDEALEIIARMPSPLAAYAFTSDKNIRNKILQSIQTGNLCFNDVMIQIANYELPFGGVGNSGMGRYHGKSSFTTFSNMKSVMQRGKIELPYRFQPFDNKDISTLKKLLKLIS